MTAILLVEDDDELREELAAILREEGFEIVTAADGREALDCLRGGPPPPLVLLDLMMPVMSGWELRAEMLADPALARVPVVVMSGAAPQNATSLQAAAYLAKPFQVGPLLDVLTRLCAPDRQAITPAP